GTGSFYNYGTITASAGSSGSAITYAGQGTVFNFSTISGPAGIVFGASASGPNFLYNSGTIRTHFGILDHSQAELTDTFYNTGMIVSDDIAFAADGMVRTYFDSTVGQVFGSIQVGSGGGTIVGGTNGETIVGGTGNDILYANPTQTAANDAAHTTLDG